MQTRGKNFLFLGFLTGSLVIYLSPLRSLFRFAWGSDTFSYIPVVPLVGAYFIYEYRKEIFARKDRWHPAGAVPIVLAILLYAIGAGQADRLALPNYLALMTLSFLSLLVGGLGVFYGVEAWKAARFPIFFLLFTAPIPVFLLDRIVVFLQRWSAEAADILFRVSGIPVFRDHFVFSLPGITIEVAKECSGIRSSLSLLLLSLLSGHLYLRTGWARTVLCIAVIPITIFKNAVRIFTLAAIAAYIDPRILGSVAHRRGGFVIFILALVLFGAVLLVLRRLEQGGNKSMPQGEPVHADPV